MACPFCGSEKTKIDTPYIDRVTGNKLQSYCCNSSKKNSKYIAQRFDPRLQDNIPTIEEVAKQ